MHFLASEIYEMWRDANHGDAPSWLSLSLADQAKWSEFASQLSSRFDLFHEFCHAAD